VAGIVTECSHLHDAAPGDAVLSTPPGRVEQRFSGAKSFSTVLNHVALGLPGGCFHSWLRQGKSIKGCAAVVLCTAGSGKLTKAALPGITNHLCSWQMVVVLLVTSLLVTRWR